MNWNELLHRHAVPLLGALAAELAEVTIARLKSSYRQARPPGP